MRGGNLLVAYHGCDITTRDDLVSGRLPALTPSQNDYDWLGSGSYFFEDDAERALLFAQASAARPEKMFTRQPIVTPAVVGAVLRIGLCLDMTTQAGIKEFQAAFGLLCTALDAQGEPLPRNSASGPDDVDVLLRKLDRAVFNFLHGVREADDLPPYDMVRAAFQQGDPVVESSAFRSHSHIQIALRNQDCVLGWFLPPGEKLLAPDDLQVARAVLGGARTSRKRRVRAAP